MTDNIILEVYCDKDKVYCVTMALEGMAAVLLALNQPLVI
jgi:hypothetical protein